MASARAQFVRWEDYDFFPPIIRARIPLADGSHVEIVDKAVRILGEGVDDPPHDAAPGLEIWLWCEEIGRDDRSVTVSLPYFIDTETDGSPFFTVVVDDFLA